MKFWGKNITNKLKIKIGKEKGNEKGKREKKKRIKCKSLKLKIMSKDEGNELK